MPSPADVTVVVPVKDRVDGLARLLAALPPGLGGLVVVDDGSSDVAGIRAVAERAGATVLRHDVARGPAAARNAGLAAAATPLVAFLDSDVVPEPGWLEPLLARLADPAVGLAAPRIVALPPVTRVAGPRTRPCGRRWTSGPTRRWSCPAPAWPTCRARRCWCGAPPSEPGFDERMQVAEDVDLVLRLHAAGWRLRYEPAARVAHDHRTTLRAWWLRKAYYGTGCGAAGGAPPGVGAADGAEPVVGGRRRAAAARASAGGRSPRWR